MMAAPMTNIDGVNMNIIEADDTHIAAIAFILRDFDKEGGIYDKTEALDTETFYQDIYAYIQDPNHVVVVAYDGVVPVGVSVFGIGKVFGRKSFEAMMAWFYVRKDYRNLSTANQILDYSVNLCKNKGARYIFASSTADFNDNGRNERAFTALLKRKKFKSIGPVLLRKD